MNLIYLPFFPHVHPIGTINILKYIEQILIHGISSQQKKLRKARGLTGFYPMRCSPAVTVGGLVLGEFIPGPSLTLLDTAWLKTREPPKNG